MSEKVQISNEAGIWLNDLRVETGHSRYKALSIPDQPRIQFLEKMPIFQKFKYLDIRPSFFFARSLCAVCEERRLVDLQYANQ